MWSIFNLVSTLNIPVGDLDVSDEEGVEKETSLCKNQGFEEI